MNNREVARLNWNGRDLVVVQGDITEEVVDAIVNPANSSLKHGGGVAGAIVRKGGKIIQEESNRIGYLPVGKAVFTTAGKLPCRFVIHTVGPVWGEGDEERKLRSAVDSVLEVASNLGLSSISIPAISTGIFGYPRREGVFVIVDEVLSWLLKNSQSSLKEIRFISIDEETVNLFKETVTDRKI
ncbi:macro domain-containing protein [Desulfurobacterium indicum]|uniref:Macrodomain protein n=1 Tax=Desulfurobacterium indicum TaxID=1914305 RepID=A0A1R1MMR9_9BACT|nr:macro domain-containing protein [Desulfurobacterium indicum]OMH40984.1 macrodomain protein [Desulfurobacterium indicum]